MDITNNNLDGRLQPTCYGLTLYEKLGVNIDSSEEEKERNYQLIKKFMNSHSKYFSLEEIDEIEEAHKRLKSILGSILYEGDIGSIGIRNTNLQYQAKIRAEKMFQNLKENLNNMVMIDYIENIDGEFVENKLLGVLNVCDDYDKVIIDNHFQISFLGDNSAIVQIVNKNKEQLYCNEHLLDKSKKESYNKETKNNFRDISWSYFIANQIRIIEQEELDNNKTYTKKI